MALHNTDALVIETDTATESLPDPTTVNGRTHQLVNTGTATVTWSSTGATPFKENGVNVATITIVRGSGKILQSDGTRWNVINNTSGRHAFSAKGTTDGSGNVTFNFASPFTVPIVSSQVESAITDITECRLTAVSTTSCTFNVRRAPSVVILGISVLQVPIPAAGVVVHCIVVEQGETL